MPTFNRAPRYLHLLAEAVESFRRQQLPVGVEAELVILNDAPGQELRCDLAGVRVVNVQERYASLGEKYNALVSLATGTVLFPWEDDDISLPLRIAQALAYLEGTREYFNPRASWYWDSRGLHHNHAHGVCHNASAFTRRAWQVAGGYPLTSGNQDAVMDSRLRQQVGTWPPQGLARNQWQYIYRWGVSPCHLSGVLDGPPSDPHAGFYQRVGQGAIEPGTFLIEPHWRQDYAQQCAARC